MGYNQLSTAQIRYRAITVQTAEVSFTILPATLLTIIRINRILAAE